MKILAIDTSTSVMGVSLLDEHKVYAEVTTNIKKNHSVRLMPMIDQMLAEVKWTTQDIELIAVAKGPGSYTGVRIGVTTAKTMAWALGTPIIGVSTLEAMAYQHQHFSGIISPIIDARRGQAYTGLYQSRTQGWNIVEEDHISLVERWASLLKQRDEQVLFVGDDVSIHKEQILQVLGSQAVFTTPPFQMPRPSVIGWLAKDKAEQGKEDNLFDFAPAYLQLAEAEAKWLEKQKLT